MDLEEVKYGEDITLAWKFSFPRLMIICKTRIVCITHGVENSYRALLGALHLYWLLKEMDICKDVEILDTGLIRAG